MGSKAKPLLTRFKFGHFQKPMIHDVFMPIEDMQLKHSKYSHQNSIKTLDAMSGK